MLICICCTVFNLKELHYHKPFIKVAYVTHEKCNYNVQFCVQPLTTTSCYFHFFQRLCTYFFK
jgi:hypothetical protein